MVYGPCFLMPDVGDVLGEESLVEHLHESFWGYKLSEQGGPIGMEEEADADRQLRRRTVLYIITDDKPFMSLSPPPSHLRLYMQDQEGEGIHVHQESLQHWLSSTHLTFLHLMPAQGKEEEARTFLCNMLHNLPPNSHLHTLIMSGFRLQAETEMEDIMDILFESSSSCKVEHLVLECDSSLLLKNPHYSSELGRRCRSLCLRIHPSERADLGCASLSSLLTGLMSSTDGKLQVLHLQYSSKLHISDHVKAFNELRSCKLKRLDMRGAPSLETEGMRLLLESISSPSCSILDLGINLSSLSHLNEDNNKVRYSIFAQPFRSGTSLSKIIALRLEGIDTDEAVACVIDILECPESNCKVRVLQVAIESYAKEPFYKRLLQMKRCRIECLRTYFAFSSDDDQAFLELSSLIELLSWENCSLLWLQCLFKINRGSVESLQMKIGNALELNYLITYLQVTSLMSPAARSRASAFLARNHRYKSIGLSKEEWMKPQVGRLFLCGDGEVGKTTLRKALLKLHNNQRQNIPAASPSNLSSPQHSISCSCSFNKLHQLMCRGKHLRQADDGEPRTRGLEIHELCFQSTQKLAIFDLGGQPDFHAFHHYFVSNTSHDLFIVDCKYTPSTRNSQVATNLEYWLRFIVSHRNTAHGPNPRILLVINFFQHADGRRLPSDMQVTANELTQNLRNKYAEQLDFGDPAHVFGIVAINTSEAQPILRKLETLLADLLTYKPKIPKLCHDVSHTLHRLAHHEHVNPYQKKQFTRAGIGWHLQCGGKGGKKASKKVLVDYTELKEQYIQQQANDQISSFEKRLQIALVELHNIGEVVFSPHTASSKITEEATLSVITDPGWFCNKVVGNLLAPEAFSGKSEWKYMDIRQVLMENGCPGQYVDDVLRFIQSLELCYPSHNDVTGEPSKYFFPAVATDRALHWPPIFMKRHGTNFEKHDGDNMHFYGRRIRCKDSERHLIPSGVFARLQVKLQTFCGVQNERSFKLGYHWVSFLKEDVGVVVLFGRVGASSMDNFCMKEDDHPEWVDILVCFIPADDDDTQQKPMSAEYSIIYGIRKLIFDICQATSRGIPTVMLEECILRNEVGKGVMPLMEIEEHIRSRGLASSIPWEDQASTPVVDLLLPEEIQHHLLSHVQVMQQIQGEFATTSTPYKHNSEEGLLSVNDLQLLKQKDEELLCQELHGEFKVLYDLINSKLDSKFEWLDSKMDTKFEWLGTKLENVLALVKEIKQDVHKVMRGLRQAEINIVSKCSSRLLTQLLVQGVLPSYPYLTSLDGKMQKLRNVLLDRKATIHFLCESRMEGPHVVKGQTGKEVVIEKGLLSKMAPFLVPTLMVTCCAASFLANAYLPGVAPLIFDPLLQLVSSLGMSEQDLKSQIMPKALSALFDGLDIGELHQYDPKESLLNINGRKVKEGKEALEKILGRIEDLDMENDFGLSLVQVGEEGNQTNQATAQWLCEHHAGRHRKLRQPNPFIKCAI